MKRKCACAGSCTPESYFTRREFIGLAGAGAAATLLAPSAIAAAASPAEDLDRWRNDLLQPGSPRRYHSQTHTDARMHLGGIGTGNFEIGADGQFTTWQLFNTLRDGDVPFHFAVKTGEVTRLLQTAAGPEAPRIKEIEMIGEYPFAHLRFLDPGLPVQIELKAFSPFAPLDSALSSVPLAVFVFRVTNPTPQPHHISLGAILQNPVGYEADGPLAGASHPNFGGNVNECFADGPLRGLNFRAEPGGDPSLDIPVAIFVTQNLADLNTPPTERPAKLTVQGLDHLPPSADKLTDPAHTVIWLEDPPADMAPQALRAARDAVRAGATLIFAGHTSPLLAAYASASGGKPLASATTRPDLLFEDFENGYAKWKVEGKAFGSKPASGTLPNQQRVSGFQGAGLVNSYLEGDATVGRLVSQPFTIERHFIRFLLGGGSHPDTQIRLLVNDKVVRAASGQDIERLDPVAWDVREFESQTGHIEIVDQNQNGWGHINVDQIEFADRPTSWELFLLVEELLPARFSRVRPVPSPGPNQRAKLSFEQFEALPDTKDQISPTGARRWVRPFGQGKVILADEALLEAAQVQLRVPRQRAFTSICAAVGANYQPLTGTPQKAPGFGSLALAALAGEVTAECGFTSCQHAWTRFAANGHFGRLETSKSAGPTAPESTLTGAVAASIDLPAGASIEVPFLLAWHFPNKYNPSGEWMGCHYATRWPNAVEVLKDAAANLKAWQAKTQLFRQTAYDTTLPYWLVDCLTSQAAIIRHIGVVFRIAKGDVYGWEGSNGCCQPTCTHVWGYEQSLAHLFPDLERDMRRTDFHHQQRDDGGVNNRTDVPSPHHPTGETPFADGHASCILKAWREALKHSDDAWWRDYWPRVKRAVEYLIARDAASNAGQIAGTLNDDQWNTYDEALHGVTTFIGTYYLAALRAGEEWAKRMGEPSTAARFHEVFVKGQQRLVELCWNGEYFQQYLPDYQTRSGEVGPGCMADQLIGQWWAHQLGLGYLLPIDKVQSALRAVFKYNWKSDLTGWKHMPRAFAGDRDRGLIICTWPKGGRPPQVMLYSDEVWTGIEYQVAAHLIYEGMVPEGLAVAKGARDRYDGVPRPPIPRSPWNEIECGGHYARAMSSWSLLLALSGFRYDAPEQSLRFVPSHTPDRFKSLFVGPEGWGQLSQTIAADGLSQEIRVVEGSLAVKNLAFESATSRAKLEVRFQGQPVDATLALAAKNCTVALRRPLRIPAGEALSLRLS